MGFGGGGAATAGAAGAAPPWSGCDAMAAVTSHYAVASTSARVTPGRDSTQLTAALIAESPATREQPFKLFKLPPMRADGTLTPSGWDIGPTLSAAAGDRILARGRRLFATT